MFEQFIFRGFLVFFFPLLLKGNILSCWNIINTTIEAPDAKLTNLLVINNELLAAYSHNFIRKWQLGAGYYIKEQEITPNKNASLIFMQKGPLLNTLLSYYSDGAIEMRNINEDLKKEISFVEKEEFIKILPIPGTNFLYLLKEKQIEKMTTAGKVLNILEYKSKHSTKTNLFKGLIYIPNSDLMVSFGNDNILKIWNIKYEKFQREFPLSKARKEEITSLEYFQKTDTLIVGTNKGEIKFFDYNIGTTSYSIQAFDSPVTKIFSYNEYILATNDKNQIKLFSEKTLMRDIELSLQNLIDIQLSIDSKGTLIGYAASSNIIKTWVLTYNYKDKCWEECPKGSFTRNLQYFCESCPLNCDECLNDHSCRVCSKNFFLDDGKCVKSCGFFKSEEEDGTCKQKMISFSNVFFASLLFIGMELVRKFWKQIRSYIQRHIKEFCNKRKYRDRFDSEKVLVQKIQELESKLHSQEFILKTRSSGLLSENTENLLKFSLDSYPQVLSFSDYAILLPYELVAYPKTKDHRIGRGGFSTVYRVELFGESWAVKKFSWNFTGESLLDFKDIQTVVNEILIMNSLHNERILRLKAFAFRIKPKKFSVKMVTELMKTDLSHVIYSSNPLNDCQKLNISLQILHGIRYLHSQKIQHLDLKPQNILLSEDFTQIKIADFGISKANYQETRKTMIIGTTLAYSSREYALENKVSPQKSDIWSFGAILFEIFANRKPWGDCRSDEIRECLYNKKDFLLVSKGNLCEEIREMVKLCMKYDTEERISSEELLKIFPREINGNFPSTIPSNT